MGLFSKLKKIGKKLDPLGHKVLGKAKKDLSKVVKHDPLGKKLLKHDPLGKAILGQQGGNKGGGGAMAQALRNQMTNGMGPLAGQFDGMNPQQAGPSPQEMMAASQLGMPAGPGQMPAGLDPNSPMAAVMGFNPAQNPYGPPPGAEMRDAGAGMPGMPVGPGGPAQYTPPEAGMRDVGPAPVAAPAPAAPAPAMGGQMDGGMGQTQLTAPAAPAAPMGRPQMGRPQMGRFGGGMGGAIRRARFGMGGPRL